MAELKEEELYLEAFNLQIPQNKKIDSSKLGEALRSVGKRLTNENIETLKKKADDECNGGITFDDFKRFVGEASKIEKVVPDPFPQRRNLVAHRLTKRSRRLSKSLIMERKRA